MANPMNNKAIFFIVRLLRLLVSTDVAMSKSSTILVPSQVDFSSFVLRPSTFDLRARVLTARRLPVRHRRRTALAID
jgi:hypothetical protein